MIKDVGVGQYAFAYPIAGLGEAAKGGVPSTAVGELLTTEEVRAVLQEHLPALMDFPWMSQAMGFPLTRANDIAPVETSTQELEATDRALRAINP